MSDRDLDTLAGYLSGYEEPPPEGNFGLFARQNLLAPATQRAPMRITASQAGLSSGFAAAPQSWFSLALAQQAATTGRGDSVNDVSGGKVVLLGKSQVVGGKKLGAGDQFFFQPVTNKVEATKTLAQLRASEGPKSTSDVRAAEANPGAGNAFETSANVRAILRGLGSPVLPRGPVDTTLVQEWRRIATANQLNPSVSAKAGDGKMAVSAGTLSALRARNSGRSTAPAPVRPVRTAPAGTKPSAAPKPGTVVATVAELQTILKGIGYSRLPQDGAFGPNTVKAWQGATQRRGLDATIGRASGTEAWVNPATLAAMRTTTSIGGKSAPVSTPVVPARTPAVPTAKTGKPTEPSKAGMVKGDVGALQSLLLKLGEKLKAGRDGSWGPDTAGAWMRAATKRQQDGTINRAGPTDAWVMPAALAALTTAAQASTDQPGKGGGAPDKPVKPVKGKPDQPSKQAMVKTGVGQIQDLLIKLGAKLKAGRDGQWGPDTAKAWQKAAGHASSTAASTAQVRWKPGSCRTRSRRSPRRPAWTRSPTTRSRTARTRRSRPCLRRCRSTR